MTWRQLRFILISAAVLLIAWLAWIRQPEQQIQRKFANLLHQVEKRNWEQVRIAVSANYQDQWGFNREDLLRLTSEVFRQFFFVEITPIARRIAVTSDVAELSAKLRLSGRGTGLAEQGITRAAELKEPFRFIWKRESWKPWDWKLASVSQSEIYLDSTSWE